MSYFKTDTQTNLRLMTLCLSILVYGCFGYPTPDNPGLVELVVGVGLVMSLGLPQSAFSLLITPIAEPLWMKTARLLLIYGLSAPLLVGVLSGNAIGAILRDIFPFLFMLLPFFAYDLYKRLNQQQSRYLLYSILSAGLVFSLRGIYLMQGGIENIQNIDALYLVNAPTVLFTALYLVGFAITTISLRSLIIPLATALLSLIPMTGMGFVLQRASFGAIALSGLFLAGFVFRKNALRFLILCVMALIGFLIFKDHIFPLLNDLSKKNQTVGSNMRFFELFAVWERIAESSITALFGQGWGGTVQSPAVGDLTVNFTHSLISAALLKTGLIGTLLTVLFLCTLFLRFPILFKTSPVLALALFWPFVIDIFLYASYKSLDFGLILMLIACYGVTKQTQIKEEDIAKNTIHKQGLSADTRGNGTYIT